MTRSSSTTRATGRSGEVSARSCLACSSLTKLFSLQFSYKDGFDFDAHLNHPPIHRSIGFNIRAKSLILLQLRECFYTGQELWWNCVRTVIVLAYV
jgi:hypothetical protein